MNTAIYVRVSTEAQGEKGYSIADQIRSCREHAMKLGLNDISEYIDDGYSGEFLERPHLDRLREDLRNKYIKNVIIYDPDRLSRNLTNQLLIADEIEKSGARIHFVTGDYDASPEGRLFFSMRGAIAEFEKAKIRERTLRGKRSKALSGKLIQNGNAFGYDWDADQSMYVINESEAAIIKTIYDLYLTGQYSLRSLAILFRQQGIYNAQGTYFTMTHIRRILTDPKYAGTNWTFKKYTKKVSQYKSVVTKRDQSEWISIPIPAIVSPKMQEDVKRILSSKYLKSPRNTAREYLLRGFIKCSVCGASMSCHYKKSKTGKEWSWYKCNSGITDKQIMRCGNPAISSLDLDRAVYNKISKAAKSKKGLLSILQQESEVDNTHQIDNLVKYQAELKKKQATVTKWFTSGKLMEDEADKALSEITTSLQETAASIRSLSMENNKKTTNSLTTEEILAAKTFTERRLVIEKLNWYVHVDNRDKRGQVLFRI